MFLEDLVLSHFMTQAVFKKSLIVDHTIWITRRCVGTGVDAQLAAILFITSSHCVAHIAHSCQQY